MGYNACSHSNALIALAGMRGNTGRIYDINPTLNKYSVTNVKYRESEAFASFLSLQIDTSQNPLIFPKGQQPAESHAPHAKSNHHLFGTEQGQGLKEYVNIPK